MRILKGKDFYDSARAYGIDTETVFVRDGLILKDEAAFRAKYNDYILPGQRGFSVRPSGKISWLSRITNRRYDVINFKRDNLIYEVTFTSVTVFVAGKRYHGIEARESSNTAFPPIRHMFWDEENFKQYIEAFECRIDTSYYIWHIEGMDRSAQAYFNPVTTNRDYEFLVSNRISVLTYGIPAHNSPSKVWTVNGDNLGYFGFAKRMDPYQLFQELSMYVGGVIPKDGPPMVEITDDKIKAHKAGFDTKWSFRRTNGHKPNS